MASYSFKTHWQYEAIKRRCFYRCKKGYYSKLDFIVSDGHTEWDRICAMNKSAFECVYTSYDTDYYLADKEEKKYNARRYRYYSYLKKMVANISSGEELCFICLTFSNEYIENKFSTLKKYVTLYLNEICTNWFACEDYGTQNGRLHFHCVCVFKSSVVDTFYYEKVKRKNHLRCFPAWRYGNTDIQFIKAGEEGKKLNYAMSCVSYGVKAKRGFEGYKPFHNRNFIYTLNNDDVLLQGDF